MMRPEAKSMDSTNSYNKDHFKQPSHLGSVICLCWCWWDIVYFMITYCSFFDLFSLSTLHCLKFKCTSGIKHAYPGFIRSLIPWHLNPSVNYNICRNFWCLFKLYLSPAFIWINMVYNYIKPLFQEKLQSV